MNPSIIYGALPYDVRQNEARRFREGETKVVVATDAIGMGLNLPIRRVVFLETEKFDGVSRRGLTATEYKQIAGRAGRYGQFEKGLYVSPFQMHRAVSAVEDPIAPIESAHLLFP
ncbi:MAG: helicase-related protein [Clostridia bacterium]|nr:helicase-related protein [Clostridia bacterium]